MIRVREKGISSCTKKQVKIAMNLYLRGGGSQISTTLDSVTERGVACEFFSNQLYWSFFIIKQ